MAECAAYRVLMDTLAKLLIDEINFLQGVKQKLRLLESELEWMVKSLVAVDNAVKYEADLNTWGKQLRGIIHEAEDVVDEFYLKTVNYKRLLINSKATTNTSSFFPLSVQNPSFLHDIGVRIGKINARANDLKKNKDRYGSVIAKTTSGGAESSNHGSLYQKINLRRAAIFAEVYQQNYVNIHEDVVRKVTPFLTRNEGDETPLRVISILGMGGVGKTTLSKKLYNLSKGFDCRARIYISKSYSLDELLKSIMNQCFGPTADDRLGGSMLELSNERLYAGLVGNKYLIVLDDVWDTDVWEDLRSSFPENKNGSIVLLTTRHEKVANSASSSSSTNIHKLNVVNDVESWQIFRNRVHHLEPALECLGKEMVKKCGGLPLAIVVLGRLLTEINMKKHAWAAVNTSARWLSSQHEDSHRCPGILALSYDYMPYYLKQCFLYMSLFPKDSSISVTKLLQYWIAEGFVTTMGEQTMEDAAEAYLDDLIGRNMIQVSRYSYDGKVKSYCIHDLYRDIAIAESQNVQFSEIYQYQSNDELYHLNQEGVRVAVYCKSGALNKQDFSESLGTKIRFLMCQNVYFKKHNYFSSLCGGFKSLRVLEFYRYNQSSCLISLPKEVGELIHLRYLSFEKTNLVHIDTSYLGKLVNLETLNLDGCVKELILDDKIWGLHKLRHLYLKSIRPTSNDSRSRWSTSTVHASGIDKLENLHLLHIQAGDWTLDGGLEKLKSLRKLRVEECSISHSDNISLAVAKLTKLQSLALISKISLKPSTTNGGIPLSPIILLNHTSLTRLHLKGKIHDWSGHNSFPPNLCKLKLEWSWIVEDPMPILDKLPSLTFLHLGYVSYLGKQMSCSKGGFVGLQTLKIVSLKNLEEWRIEEGALVSLTRLEICDCKNLKKIPDGLQRMTTLRELELANMPLQFQNRMRPGREDWDMISHIPSRHIHG